MPSVNTFLEDFFSRDIFDWTDRNYAAIGSNLPSVNLRETDTKVEIEMAVPGMKKEDFKVEIVVASFAKVPSWTNKKSDFVIAPETLSFELANFTQPVIKLLAIVPSEVGFVHEGASYLK